MDERGQVLVATVLGATVGCVLGCLYLTDRGQVLRDRIVPLFDTVIDELQQIRKTLEKARDAVEEGRRTIDDIFRPPSSAS